MDKLAIFGGTPVRTKPFPTWPKFNDDLKNELIHTMENDGWGVGSNIINNF